MTGEDVVESVAEAYEERAPQRGAESRAGTEGTRETAPPGDAGSTDPDTDAGDGPAPLPERLVDALGAGHEAGGEIGRAHV